MTSYSYFNEISFTNIADQNDAQIELKGVYLVYPTSPYVRHEYNFYKN